MVVFPGESAEPWCTRAQPHADGDACRPGEHCADGTPRRTSNHAVYQGQPICRGRAIEPILPTPVVLAQATLDLREPVSLADGITVSRMMAAPLLLAAAVSGYSRAFLAIALYGFLSDAGDGLVARIRTTASVRGAQLDSRADFYFYTAVLLGLVWLFPARLGEHWMLLGTVAAAYATPIAAGWLKFHRLTSYHTFLARASLVLLAAGLFAWLLLDSILPLQVGTVVLVLSAIEELAITRLLTEIGDNIPTVFRLLNNTPSEKIDACNPPWPDNAVKLAGESTARWPAVCLAATPVTMAGRRGGQRGVGIARDRAVANWRFPRGRT